MLEMIKNNYNSILETELLSFINLFYLFIPIQGVIFVFIYISNVYLFIYLCLSVYILINIYFNKEKKRVGRRFNSVTQFTGLNTY